MSLSTTVGLVLVAWIQRKQVKQIEGIRQVADETHEVTKVIKTDVNNNWQVASERIDQLQSALQSAGVKIPSTPLRPTS
jgi:hypothetical protein